MAGIEKYGWVNAARGYAILLVVMIHVPQFLFEATNISLLANTGNMGVQLFFVMSSFTLFNSYTKRSREDGTNTKRAFFVRRLFRIAPQYWLAAVFYAALSALYSKIPTNYLYLFSNIFFINGLYLPSIVYVPPGGWSIGVEMAFYLTIPLLFRLATNVRSAVVLTIVAVVASNLINYAEYVYVQQHELNWVALREYELYFWFPNQFPVFCFGVVLYYLYVTRAISVRAGNWLLFGSILAFLGLCLVPFSVEYPWYFFQKEYIYAFVFMTFAAGLYASGSRLLATELIQRIGVVSFSLYLNHFFVLMVLKAIEKRYFAWAQLHAPTLLGYLRNDLVLVAYYVLTVFLAYNLSRATYRYVELNGIRLGERLLERLGWSTSAARN